MNGARLVVAALAAEGVRQVYGIPGTTIMDVLDALAGQDTVRYLSVRHEQVAASIADGYARASGGAGVCIASRGPGATNMATAFGTAYDESVPVVGIIGQVAGGIAHREAFEELDVVSMFRPVTKWAVEITRPERIPELLQRAIRLAVSGRPGPVVVSLPLDVLKASADVPVQRRFRPAPPRPDAARVRDAARLLAAAERPAVIVGGGVRSFDENVTGLAERLRAPVVTTWSRKDRFANDHPQFLGALGPGAFGCAQDAVRDADAVVALGCRFSEFTTARWTLLSPETALVHVDIDAAELGKIYVPEVGLQADAGLAARDLAGALDAEAPPGAAREQWLSRLRTDYLARRELTVPPPSSAISSAELTAALRDVLARTPAILVADAPSFAPWIWRHVDFASPGRHIASAAGAMAWGFPAALGVQLARPDDRVICVSGDGSFWMVAQDLETAVREKIPVVTVIANNFAYGNTRDRQRIAHGERYFGVFYDNPDFAEFARLNGAHGERVTRAADLGPALDRALAAGGPAVVDIVQDRHEGLPPDLTPMPAR
ncbi:thiamine pyrophosphate-binding protein [Actinomadura darangshiensis]|uniref:Thiamine pyrophosphate-binding protein n=1 Tax=Actinomadura darangshiensis TaxID=705336 RepID=A0A4R5AF71_9ACTN|nr:thiamine pyrophosphate-binding protein [Actinomadura darangshiensis]TDD70315.1 thiamine pyrophosphate-binding protein [Actinomadura darangshiensis]